MVLQLLFWCIFIQWISIWYPGPTSTLDTIHSPYSDCKLCDIFPKSHFKTTKKPNVEFRIRGNILLLASYLGQRKTQMRVSVFRITLGFWSLWRSEAHLWGWCLQFQNSAFFCNQGRVAKRLKLFRNFGTGQCFRCPDFFTVDTMLIYNLIAWNILKTKSLVNVLGHLLSWKAIKKLI